MRYRPRFKNRYRNSSRKSFKGRLAILMLAVIAFLIMSEIGLGSISKELTQESAERYISGVVNSAVEDIMNTENSGYTDITYDSSGKIASISTNAEQMNSLKNSVIKEINERINGEYTVKVPFGSLTNIKLLNGRGFKVPVKLSFEGTVSVKFDTEFASSGLNQSCHRVTMLIEVSVYSQSKNFSAKAAYSSEYVISETVLVGEVPSIYKN